MGDVTFWTGPVSIAMTQSAIVPGSEHKVIECRGSLFTPLCSELSAALLDTNGRRLPNLLIRLKVDVAHMRDLVLSAFSAGGALLRSIVSHPADRAMIRAVMLSDGTYASWDNNKQPLISQDWLTWGAELANGASKLWVATSSPSPNGANPNGVEVLREIRAQLEAKVGRTFTPIPDFFGITPKPDAAYQLGNVVFAEYPLQPLAHGGHVTLAQQTFSKILVPWLAAGGTFGTPLPPGPGPEPEPLPPGVEPPPPVDATDEEWMRWIMFALCVTGSGLIAYQLVERFKNRRRR